MKINVARFINMETADFRVEVLTPMFLGGASGDAELRSPPFKNALRYWWRIIQGNIPDSDLRQKEKKLFGGINNKANRSLVNILVIGDVKIGEAGQKADIGDKINPEARNRNVPLSAYLGMGVVDFNGTYLKKYILPGQAFKLTVSFPQKYRQEILDTLSLIKAFGTFGARSRNGWGSIDLTVIDQNIELLSRKQLFEWYGEDLTQIFNVNKKYPFRLGKTSHGPLLWQIKSGNNWKGVMQAAGERYMDLRQQQELAFPRQVPSGLEKRHILGYPVTNHKFPEWGGNNGRMPSQLRIFVRKHDNQYTSYFFHLPHRLPKPWDEQRLGCELALWKVIHKYIDQDNQCQRVH